MLPDNQQPKNGDIYYASLKVIHAGGVDVYTAGDSVKLDTRPLMYGKVMYFIKKGNPNELDEVYFCRLPEQVFAGFLFQG